MYQYHTHMKYGFERKMPSTGLLNPEVCVCVWVWREFFPEVYVIVD